MGEREVSTCEACVAAIPHNCEERRALAPAEAVDPMQVRINLQCPNGHTRTITTSCACHPAPARGEAVTEAGDLRAEVRRLRDAILWALGESDVFPVRMMHQGPYWWRKELRERAALARPDRERAK